MSTMSCMLWLKPGSFGCLALWLMWKGSALSLAYYLYIRVFWNSSAEIWTLWGVHCEVVFLGVGGWDLVGFWRFWMGLCWNCWGLKLGWLGFSLLSYILRFEEVKRVVWGSLFSVSFWVFWAGMRRPLCWNLWHEVFSRLQTLVGVAGEEDRKRMRLKSIVFCAETGFGWRFGVGFFGGCTSASLKMVVGCSLYVFLMHVF